MYNFFGQKTMFFNIFLIKSKKRFQFCVYYLQSAAHVNENVKRVPVQRWQR